MYKTILVALDISNEAIASKVFAKAIEIAQKSEAKLHTISILPDFGNSIVADFLGHEHVKQALHQFSTKTLDFIKTQDHAGVNVRPHVVTGSVYDEILSSAQKLGADLIIIGAQNPKLSNYLLGPNAARVARHAPVSVLVVR